MSSKTDVTDDELQRLIDQNRATALLSDPRVEDVAVERALENETFIEKLGDELGLVREEEFEAAVQAEEDSEGEIKAGFAAGTSDDPEDYAVGSLESHTPIHEREDLTAQQRESIRKADRRINDSEPLEAYASGHERQEYKEREREIEIMAEALRRVGLGEDDVNGRE